MPEVLGYRGSDSPLRPQEQYKNTNNMSTFWKVLLALVITLVVVAGVLLLTTSIGQWVLAIIAIAFCVWAVYQVINIYDD